MILGLKSNTNTLTSKHLRHGGWSIYEFFILLVLLLAIDKIVAEYRLELDGLRKDFDAVKGQLKSLDEKISPILSIANAAAITPPNLVNAEDRRPDT